MLDDEGPGYRATAGDRRVCFVGDSFVAGTGDPDHLGWTGRLAVRSAQAGWPVTAYNLGVRRDTSRDVLGRWEAECRHRLPRDCDGRVLLSVGTNDTALEGGGPRVAPGESAAGLEGLVRDIAGRWPLLVVGPPPVADVEHTGRTAALDAHLGSTCARLGIPFVPVLAPLRGDPDWLREVAVGDGAHPGAAGYATLAALVWPRWQRWWRG